MTLESLFRPKGRKSTQGWREIDGEKYYFRSRWEANYGKYLAWLKKQGAIADWQHEPETLWFNDIRRGTNNYKPDFTVTEKNGSRFWVEVKGYYSKKDHTKIKRFNKYYPNEKLLLIDSKWFKKNRPTFKNLIPGWE